MLPLLGVASGALVPSWDAKSSHEYHSMMDLSRVVTFTNITSGEFTHLYHGVPYSVAGGSSKIFPYDLARHLAKHLARKILFTSHSERVSKLGLPQYSPELDKPLYAVEDEEALIARILGEVSSAPVAKQLSPEEILRQRVDELNANPPEGATTGRTKADVIADLEKLGQPVDKRNSMASLEEQLAKAKSLAE